MRAWILTTKYEKSNLHEQGPKLGDYMVEFHSVDVWLELLLLFSSDHHVESTRVCPTKLSKFKQ